MNIEAILLALAITFCLQNSIYGCSCYSTESFNLYEYDYSENIAEIKIISKIKDDYEGRIAQYHRDTANWDKPHPPMPPLPPAPYVDYEIELIQTFKGNLSIPDMKLRSENSSCSWYPKIGETYLLYLGDVIISNAKKTLGIGACIRKLQKGNKRYEEELEILKNLKKSSNGNFKIQQTELNNISSKSYFPVRGKFKNKKRHGRWVLSEPLMWSTKIIVPRKKVMILKYKNGVLLSTKCPKSNDLDDAAKRKIHYWERFYNDLN